MPTKFEMHNNELYCPAPDILRLSLTSLIRVRTLSMCYALLLSTIAIFQSEVKHIMLIVRRQHIFVFKIDGYYLRNDPK